MRQKKKVKRINGFKIWLGKLIGTRCPECGGKVSFHHYKRCSKYKKETPEVAPEQPVVQDEQS